MKEKEKKVTYRRDCQAGPKAKKNYNLTGAKGRGVIEETGIMKAMATVHLRREKDLKWSGQQKTTGVGTEEGRAEEPQGGAVFTMRTD